MNSPTLSATAVAVAPTPKASSPAMSNERRGPRVWFLLLAALNTAGLLWLSYFPVNCGWLAWFALVPFLALVRATARPRIVYLCAWLGGLVFYFTALQWMRVADPRMYYTWIALAIYCSLYFPLALLLIRFLERRTRLPLVLTLPVVWTALEFFRSWFGTGFSWYLVGYTQHDFLPVIQIADLAGVYGVTFLVVAVNAVLFEALYRWAWFRTRFAGPNAPAPGRPVALALQAGVVAAALLAAVGYGEWRLSQDAFTPGPRVALIQGNVPQQIRNNTARLMEPQFKALCDLASAQKPNLIVWPENSFPRAWLDARRSDPAGRRAAQVPDDWESIQREKLETIGLWKAPMLLGTDAYTVEAGRPTYSSNSAVLVDAAYGFHGRYDKIHCVPFGEYVPLREWFPWMNYFAPYDFDYSVTPGRETTHFDLDAGRDGRFAFGVAICYEDTDPDRTRPYAGGDGKPPVDFLLNISNDGWFDGTSEHDEHLAICRFRAIECRRSIGRAVNMGISAVIDPDGRVLAPQAVPNTEWADVRATIDAELLKITNPEDREKACELFPSDHDHRSAVWLVSPGAVLPAARWAEYKKTPCVLLAEMPIDHRVSLYALWGDWLIWCCWALLGGAIVWAFVRPRLPAGSC